MRRWGMGLATALVAAGVLASTGGAQQTAPAVAVTASPTAVALNPSGPLAAGPTRFDFTRQGDDDVSVFVFLLNAGVTFEEFQETMAGDDRNQGEVALGKAWIQGSTTLAGRDTARSVTITLRPGQTYYVMAERDEERGPRQRAYGSFTTTGQGNGVTATRPEDRILMRGLRFRGDRSLARQGTVRFENADGLPHFALAFPLRSSVTTRQFGRALRSNSERAFGRLLAGAPYPLQNLLSGGGIVNDQSYRFPRAGRYGLVCFVAEHHRLGMYRIIRVR